MSPLSPLLQLAFILWGRGCLSYWFHLKSRWRYQTRISIPKFSKIISQKNTRSSTFRNANRFNHRHTFLLLWCQSKTLFISDQWSVFKWGDHHEIQQPRTWESLPKLCAHIAHIILLYGLCHIIHIIWYKDQTIDALTKFSQFDAPVWLIFRPAIMTQLECLIECFRIYIFVCWFILYIWDA